MTGFAFVILHYGDVRVTDTCVRSIRKIDRQKCTEIVIVDNDVQKEQTERKRFEKRYNGVQSLHVIQNRGKGGFSEGNNLGYRFAREILKCQWVIITNNDVLFLQDGFTEKILKIWEKAFDGQRCHIISPDVRRPDVTYAEGYEHQSPLDRRLRTISEAAFTVRMNRLSLFWFSAIYPFLLLQDKAARAEKRRRKTAEIDFYEKEQKNVVPFGACLIFTPLFTKEQGEAFAPETMFFYEEYLLKLRCDRLQYRILYSPEVWVEHESGHATRSALKKTRRQLKFQLEQTAGAASVYLRELTE